MRDLTKLIGQKVIKLSVSTQPKPFKSGNIFNTVKGIMIHPLHPDKTRLAFTFYEDDSFVECNHCVSENEYPELIFLFNVYKITKESEGKDLLKTKLKQLKRKIKEEIHS